MASTTKTTNLELSQFVGTDKPAWLTDYNGDMQKIDEGYKKLEDANTATQTDLNATKQDLSGSKTDINDVKADVQALEAQDITLGNRLTVLEGNYDTMHHEVAINTQKIAVLESENVVKEVNTISNLIGNNVKIISRLAGNAYFIRIKTTISGNTLTSQSMNYIADIDISEYNPIPNGKENIFIGSAFCTYTENGTSNIIRTYNDIVITNTGKIGIYISQYVDVTKDVIIEFNTTIPVKIVR